jgi:hypothetical protein
VPRKPIFFLSAGLVVERKEEVEDGEVEIFIFFSGGGLVNEKK